MIGIGSRVHEWVDFEIWVAIAAPVLEIFGSRLPIRPPDRSWLLPASCTASHACEPYRQSRMKYSWYGRGGLAQPGRMMMSILKNCWATSPRSTIQRMIHPHLGTKLVSARLTFGDVELTQWNQVLHITTPQLSKRAGADACLSTLYSKIDPSEQAAKRVLRVRRLCWSRRDLQKPDPIEVLSAILRGKTQIVGKTSSTIDASGLSIQGRVHFKVEPPIL